MKWIKNNWDKVIYAAILTTFLIMTFKSISGCDGTIVRGVFWFECIGE